MLILTCGVPYARSFDMTFSAIVHLDRKCLSITADLLAKSAAPSLILSVMFFMKAKFKFQIKSGNF